MTSATYDEAARVIAAAMPLLTDNELRIALAVASKTYGWGKDSDRISYSQFVTLTGRAKPAINAGLKGLIARGWLEQTAEHVGRGGQGFRYLLRLDLMRTGTEAYQLGTGTEANQYASVPVRQRTSSGDLPQQDAENSELVRQRTSSGDHGARIPRSNGQNRELVRQRTGTPAYPHGGGGGEDHDPPPPPRARARTASPAEQLLAAEGFSATAVREFGHLEVDVLRADIARRRAAGQGNGAIVNAWRVAPPEAARANEPPQRVSDMEILRAPIAPQLRDEWQRRFRAAPPEQRAGVLAQFRTEVLEPMGRAL